MCNFVVLLKGLYSIFKIDDNFSEVAQDATTINMKDSDIHVRLILCKRKILFLLKFQVQAWCWSKIALKLWSGSLWPSW